MKCTKQDELHILICVITIRALSPYFIQLGRSWRKVGILEKTFMIMHIELFSQKFVKTCFFGFVFQSLPFWRLVCEG